jgi:hypothetical protein
MASKPTILMCAMALVFPGSVLGQTNAAYVGYRTGNQLYQDCTSPNVVGCLNYIMGVVDTISAYQASGHAARLLCAPPAPGKQLMDVVVRWLETHPEDRHLGAAALTSQALHEAWPCR